MIRSLALLALLTAAWWLPEQAPALDQRLLPPGLAHPLGTDHLGRDLAARVLAGGRPTIEALGAALALVACVGLPLGLLGATRHGAAARFIMSLLLAMPGLLLAIIIAGVAGGLAPWLAGLALGLPAAGQAGLLTAELGARALAELHARAAVALGAGPFRVLYRHVAPELRPALLAWAAARLPRLGLGYAGFVFLGLGADLGRADWGVMVWEYRTYAVDAPWMLAAPALGMAGLAWALRGAFRALAPRPVLPASSGMIILLLLFALMTPVRAQTLQVTGITAPVEIITDRHGIPHITARTQEDAFFGQGYAAATSRLWQMDYVRRRSLGRAAAIYGPGFLPFDEAARTLHFRGDIEAEWARQEPRARALATAWVAGINARITEVLANPALLPPEFQAIGAAPEPWHVDELIRARHAGAPNARAEMRRAILACQGLLALDGLLQPLEPATTPMVPEGLDPCRLRREQIAVLDRITGSPPWSGVERRAALDDDPDQGTGSNAWVVAPGRSGSEHALLAGDPHLPVAVPGGRFITHLRAPGVDAIGLGQPWRPGFQVGHNDQVAVARTDLQIDGEDLHVLELNADGTAWRGPGGWEPISRATETIAVRDAPDAVLIVGLTRLGPIIFEDRAARHALVLRSLSLQSGPAIALEHIATTLARDWGEFRAALRFAVWGSNYLYADRAGNIGWQTGGRAPLHNRHDGLLPVPAAGGLDWVGELAPEAMIGRFNPPEGWLSSSNQMPYPEGFPAERMTSREWIAPDRHHRVAAVLGNQAVHDAAAARALQQDTLSSRALIMQGLLAGLDDTPPEAALLRGWDGRLEAGIEAATLMQFWLTELARAMREQLVPEAARAALPFIHHRALLPLAALPEHRALFASSLHRAAERFRALPLGGRAWGARHRVDLRHPMTAVLRGADVTGGGSGGDSFTVMARWPAGPGTPRVTGGAGFRTVIDLADWDRALAINLPGQSGDPGSPHYRDHYAPWIAGEMLPLAYSPAAVEALAESRLTLVP